MKKYLFLLLQLLIATIINAQVTYKYTSSNLNLREGPNISYKVLTIIPKGTQVEMAEDCDCDWIKVYYNGNTGYVSSKYLSNQIINSETSSVSTSKNKNTSIKYYTNSNGEQVQSPTYYNSAPAGATALCRDGTYSFSKNRRGTCSHHGGVEKWLK